MKKAIITCISAALILVLGTGLLAQTVQFRSGQTVRAGALSNFYKMVSWDDSQYQEFAYYKQPSSGPIQEFMNWRVIFPAGFNRAASEKYPMIIMLHGAGESGRKWTDYFQYPSTDPRYDNNGHHLLWGGSQHRDAVNRAASNHRSFPGIVIFPQVSFNGAWDTNDKAMLEAIIEYMIAEYDVDQFRIYQHGLSNGAKGTWAFASERPDLIAAILPMSGVGNNIEVMTDTLVTTPVWLFQGGLDINPSPSAANQWIAKLVEKGGRPRYSLYPELDHGTWNTAYNENDFFSWMLDKNKRKIFVFGDPNPKTASADVPVKLGISAGYLEYQWRLNGANIAGATDRYYTASAEGVYTVRFKLRTDGTWVESYPVNLSPIIQPADLVYIPDTNFKSWLVANASINTNGDSEIQYSEAQAFTGQISVNGKKIVSLTGIEAFTALTDLRVLNNSLITLDVSANVNLKELHVQTNDLVSLDVSANTQLTKLRAFDNELTNLNIKNGNNTKLTLFEATGNRLTCIQVDNVAYAQANFATKVDPGVLFRTLCEPEAVVFIPNANFKNALLANTAINTNRDAEIQVSEAVATQVVNVASKNITDLTGISAFTSLTHLYCADNQLTSIDVRQNVNLTELHCQNNLLTQIRFAGSLAVLEASGNRLTSLDISATPVNSLNVGSNRLTLLNLKSGTPMGFLFAKLNPNLSCILVDNVAYAEENFVANVDEGTEFSTTCVGGNVVFIPDANFKAALLANTAINTNGDGKIQLAEASSFTGIMYVNGKGIADATGLEAFTSLTDLRIFGNQLTTLNISANTQLLQLHCQQNDLVSLDISANTKLTKLRCFDNALTSLNLQNGKTLNLFDARINQLTCIQVDNVAYAQANYTSKVDAGVVFRLSCGGSEAVVNIPDANFKAALLANASINANGDGEIQVSEALATQTMDVSSKGILDMTGVGAFTSLTHLYCGNNQLTTIDVRENVNLTELYCQNNLLTQIRFTGTLNVLDATSNRLASLNLSTTPVNSLIVGDNLLTSLNLQNGTVMVQLFTIGNPNLDCILVDDVAYAETNFSATVDGGADFSTTCGAGGSVVNIPDVNFKTALLAITAINTNGDGEIQNTEAAAFTGTMNVTGKGIADATGLEAFTALTDLRIVGNRLTVLNVSANTMLTQLHTQQNDLVSLDISANTRITKFRFFDNALTSLNVKNGNNHRITLFDGKINNLMCIQVDNVTYATTNFTSKVDPGVSFSTDCSGGAGRFAEEASTLEEDSTVVLLSDVSVFPNPFNDRINVMVKNEEIIGQTLIISDISGKVYKPREITYHGNKAVVDLENLASGLYIMQLNSHKFRIFKR